MCGGRGVWWWWRWWRRRRRRRLQNWGTLMDSKKRIRTWSRMSRFMFWMGGLQFSPLLDNRSSRSGQTASDVERTSTMSLNAFCHFDICTLDDGDWRYVFGVMVMFRGILWHRQLATVVILGFVRMTDWTECYNDGTMCDTSEGWTHFESVLNML